MFYFCRLDAPHQQAERPRQRPPLKHILDRHETSHFDSTFIFKDIQPEETARDLIGHERL